MRCDKKDCEYAGEYDFCDSLNLQFHYLRCALYRVPNPQDKRGGDLEHGLSEEVIKKNRGDEQ